MTIDVSSKLSCASPGLVSLGVTYLLNTENDLASTNDLFAVQLNRHVEAYRKRGYGFYCAKHLGQTKVELEFLLNAMAFNLK